MCRHVRDAPGERTRLGRTGEAMALALTRRGGRAPELRGLVLNVFGADVEVVQARLRRVYARTTLGTDAQLWPDTGESVVDA